ncbi:MAG: DNA-3-methyladenine glycosylase [bacterium]|nr:DNA-3-methyladenine glycosylase [bacterium]
MSRPKVLQRKFYDRSAGIVARELLGKILVRRWGKHTIAGMIVETESYGGKDDPASHAYKKRTPRNKVMFGPAGHAYVYFCYGNHYLFNVVADKENVPAAVLIRALEPLEGLGLMKKNRGTGDIGNLTNGPGKLAQALGIDKRFNTIPLFRGDLKILDTGHSKIKIAKAGRIGITLGADKLFRFYIKDNPYVSKI